jgi:outer membrane protein OmpA-like peptidoglycan-associated protein
MASLGYKSDFVLEPRFRLTDAIEITESEMPDFADLKGIPYLSQNTDAVVEIYTSIIPEGVNYNSESILMILESDIDNGKMTDAFTKLLKSYLTDSEERTYYKTFSAVKDKVSHGKIIGKAFIKVVEYYNEKGELEFKLPVNKTQTGILNFSNDYTDLSNRRGCLSVFGGNYFSSFFSKFGSFGQSSIGANQRLGCLSPFLKLFGLLGLLIALLTFGLSTCNNNSSQTSDVPVQPIRDTVYMEVVKTIVDTLTITKSDTVSFVDSTINTTYEMVSLPNVQFYTNSRVLLPSSVSDLQKLAEYLIKNMDLTATIFGHTDNVGNPEVNLKLSQERAESVKQFLMNLGIESKRLNAVGMGASKPKGDNSTEEGRMLNRRVEVKLVESEKTETIRTQSQNPINN